MGKLNYDVSIQHFGHVHPLELLSIQQQYPNLSSCSGCKLRPSEWIYVCKPCNYILHVSCSQMPQLIHHPADPNHALTLLPQSVYDKGRFRCDACGHQGDGFCYHCGTCGLDIHILCAIMPLSLTHQTHPHPLNLVFSPPYPTKGLTKGFSCDMCHQVGSDHWLYRCNACEFDAHLNCATSKPRVSSSVQHHVQSLQPQTLLQHHNSFPMASHHQFRPAGTAGQPANTSQRPNFYVHSQSMGSMQMVQPLQNTIGGNNLIASHHQFRPAGTAGQPANTSQRPNFYVHGQSTGSMQRVQSLQNTIGGYNLIGTAIQGLVDGAAQQVGQNFVQSMLGGNDGGTGATQQFGQNFGIFGGNDGDAGTGAGADTSASVVDIVFGEA